MSHIVRRKSAFCICENKDAYQLRGYRAADQWAFVFATHIVQSHYLLNPKFQASSYLLWLYSTVCVRPVGNPKDRFSHDTAQIVSLKNNLEWLHRLERKKRVKLEVALFCYSVLKSSEPHHKIPVFRFSLLSFSRYWVDQF